MVVASRLHRECPGFESLNPHQNIAIRGYGGTGRRNWFRSNRRKAWGFKSLYPYQKFKVRLITSSTFVGKVFILRLARLFIYSVRAENGKITARAGWGLRDGKNLRVWYMGCATAFQAVETSSSLVARSNCPL